MEADCKGELDREDNVLTTCLVFEDVKFTLNYVLIVFPTLH